MPPPPHGGWQGFPTLSQSPGIFGVHLAVEAPQGLLFRFRSVPGCALLPSQLTVLGSRLDRDAYARAIHRPCERTHSIVTVTTVIDCSFRMSHIITTRWEEREEGRGTHPPSVRALSVCTAVAGRNDPSLPCARRAPVGKDREVWSVFFLIAVGCT